MEKIKVTIIGAGNVGTHLAKRFFEKKIEIIQIFSRELQKAEILAKEVEAKATNDLTKINDLADVYIVAVKDDAIEMVARQLPFKSKLVVHTSGAKSSKVFESHIKNYGVFYPLQTFSISKEANFEALPICIFAELASSQLILNQLAKRICPNVYVIDDEQRATLHVCAVMVNNFTNFMYVMAEDILNKEQLKLDILRPLIQETVNKIQKYPAQLMQTGPARREDKQTISQHLQFLEKYPDYHKVYELLSESIIQKYK